MNEGVDDTGLFRPVEVRGTRGRIVGDAGMKLLRLYAVGEIRFLLQLNGRQYGPIVAGMGQP